MFISVDFPAPFSPSSACTSPRRSSKSTWSFATTPGKRFVMPMSSRRGASSAMRGVERAPPPAPPVCFEPLLDRVGDGDVAVDDLLLDVFELLLVRLGHVAVEL